MTDDSKDLPRDLRALCTGFEVDPDGTYRALFDPVNAYANVFYVRRELEEMIEDPETPVEEIAFLLRELEFVKREESNIRQRIVNHFTPHESKPGAIARHPFPKVDQGVKNKVMKLIADIDAGVYHLRSESKTLQAVRRALALSPKKKDEHMPSPSDLKKIGYNTQQVTDAGKWLETHEDLTSKLRDGRGRPKKK